MEWLRDLSVISGPVPWIIIGIGVVGGGWLLAAGTWWYRTKALPIAVTTATVITVLLYVLVEKALRPFPDGLALGIYVWVGIGMLALTLLGLRIRASRTPSAVVVSVAAAAGVVLMSASQVNLVFEAYPTVGTVFGIEHFTRVELADLADLDAEQVIADRPLESAWAPPEGMRNQGRVLSVPVPGTVSGFTARNAEIYLPPAYFEAPRPLLPVLVLLAGQPGHPYDWLAGGKLTTTMDAFAAQHRGLAPVVVVADGTGSQLANPLCVNSPLGDVATYLAKDLPDWVQATLEVNPDPAVWAIGGLSYGGTCSLQIATNYPEVYPTFLDLSGQGEPTLGDRRGTIAKVFAGSEAAFRSVNPLDLMITRKFPTTAGVFVVGAGDTENKPGVEQVYQAADASGMDVRYIEVPGGHSFAVWSVGLQRILPWLATRLGITP